MTCNHSTKSPFGMQDCHQLLMILWSRSEDTTQVEKELDRKTKPRYLGPYRVIRRTQGGSYVIQELDGAVSRRGIAAFRLIPYIARDTARLRVMEEGPDEEDDNESIADTDKDDKDTEEDDDSS